jgi:hypothetical protein
MIKRYNNLSFLFFIPGVLAQIVGLILSEKYQTPGPLSIVALLLILGGTIMAFIGFGYYANAKGRSMLWGTAAFIGLPGLLVLSLLKDRSGDPWNT